MENKKVSVQLHTPILIEVKTGQSQHVFNISGTISFWHQGGFVLKAEDLKSEKGEKLDPLSSEIFLPFHKVDHMMILA